MSETNLTTVNNITPERRKLLACLETGTFESITALCEEAGVTRNVYYDAINSPEFVDELFKTSTGAIYAAIPQIMTKMIKQAKAGSSVHQTMLLSMVKLYQGVPAVAIQNNTVNNYQLTEEDKENWAKKYLESNGWEVIRR
jgi:hypothetical protein